MITAGTALEPPLRADDDGDSEDDDEDVSEGDSDDGETVMIVRTTVG